VVLIRFCYTFSMNNVNPSEPAWVKDLNVYVLKCRKDHPIPLRENLSELEEQMCRINGGAIINWFQKYGPSLLQGRSQEWLFGKELDKDPYIIFVTDITGLVAANEIFSPLPPKTIFLLPEELKNWKNSESFDPMYHQHIWASSFFSDKISESLTLKVKEKFPLASGSSHLFHHEGTQYAGDAGLGGIHVWEWKGTGQPTLLEEAAEKWIS
jgi:hypothetical protein